MPTRNPERTSSSGVGTFLRALRGQGSPGVAFRLSLGVAVCLATVKLWIPLTAAPKSPADRQGVREIRLRAPAFGQVQQSARSTASSTAITSHVSQSQVVRPPGRGYSGGPQIVSRQQARLGGDASMSGSGRPAPVAMRFSSHTRRLPTDAENNDAAQTEPTQTVPQLPWSQFPEKTQVTPEEVEKTLRAKNDTAWSDLPDKRETLPAEVNRSFQEDPQLNWSIPPRSGATAGNAGGLSSDDEARPLHLYPEHRQPTGSTEAPAEPVVEQTPSAQLPDIVAPSTQFPPSVRGEDARQQHRLSGPPSWLQQQIDGPAQGHAPADVPTMVLPNSAGDRGQMLSAEQNSLQLLPEKTPLAEPVRRPSPVQGLQPEQNPPLSGGRYPELPQGSSVPQFRYGVSDGAPPAASATSPVGQPPVGQAPVGQTPPSAGQLQYADPQPPVGSVPPEAPMSEPIRPGMSGGHSFLTPSPSPEATEPVPQRSPQETPSQNGIRYMESSPQVLQSDRVPAPVSGHSFGGPPPGTSGYRATNEADAGPWMAPYNGRVGQTGSLPPSVLAPSLPPIPLDYVPWWDTAVRQPAGLGQQTIPVDVGGLLRDAMQFSPQVTAIKTEPEVQYRVVTQEAARFDWTVFLNAKYDDLNDPVGNTLTTGNGKDRLITRKVRTSGGLRRRNLKGGELSLTQDFGHENQNSRFFVPNNQASSRLELTYRQPLLDGAGRSYNESEIVLARIRANSSEDEVVEALQDHLIEVTKAYWTLYRARAEYFQRRKLLTSAEAVLHRLQGRSQVDTIPRQVLRASAAVARAKTGIQRTVARVQDAEAQLRLLVNSPAMLSGAPIELTPVEPPRLATETADLQSVLNMALMNRPDISAAIRRIRASTVRLGVSRQEILPRLDFLVETYVADLAGNSNLGRALRGQFYDNRPGYTVGLEFEYPLENRAARAKLQQRQWELKRSINVFRATVEKSLTDVEIARREVSTAWVEMQSRYQALIAAEKEAAYLQDRFDVLPATEDSAILLLEDLLDSFERVADEEAAFVQAQVDHAVALVMLKKELGILLKSRHSRPEIGSAERQWMDDRLISSGGSSVFPDTGDEHAGGADSKPMTAGRSEFSADVPVEEIQPGDKADDEPAESMWRRATRGLFQKSGSSAAGL